MILSRVWRTRKILPLCFSKESFSSRVSFKVPMMFPGQGSQFVGMGVNLTNRSSSMKLFDVASSILGYDLFDICIKGPQEKLDSTEVAQPAIFVASMASLKILEEDSPDLFSSISVVLGLSLGEYSAYCAAGAFSFETGVRLTKARGEAMQYASDLTPSGMVATVGLTLEKANELCKKVFELTGKEIWIANILSDSNFAFSGSADACDCITALARDAGAQTVLRLPVSGAFHTCFMDPAVTTLRKALDEAEIHSPRIPVIANVDAMCYFTPEDIRDTLMKQITSPVQWNKSMKKILDSGEFSNGYEIGPGNVCKGIFKRMNRRANIVSVSC